MSPNPNKAIRGCGPLSTHGFFDRLRGFIRASFFIGCLAQILLVHLIQLPFTPHVFPAEEVYAKEYQRGQVGTVSILTTISPVVAPSKMAKLSRAMRE